MRRLRPGQNSSSFRGVTPFDRQVRVQIYRHVIASSEGPSVAQIAAERGWAPDEVAEAFHRLASEHRIVLLPEEDRVWMAHPFSGVETGYEVIVGNRSWFANCAWDALGVLALMGDGKAISAHGETELVWSVANGTVSPDGVIHLPVPAREFWDDIGFT